MIDHLTIARMVQRGYGVESGHVWGVEWYVQEIGDEVLITFRGSDGVGDWLRNFLAFPCRGKYAKLGHYGFVRAGERAIATGLPLWIKRLYGKDTPITFAGHSKGVESLPCALMFKDLGFNVKEWVGFGCPRIWVSKDPLPFPATNYIIHGDIVPLVAPWFNHRGKVVYLKRVVPTLYPGFENHHVELYVKRLRELLQNAHLRKN